MKPRILILTRYYYPAFLAGGPVRSISNMVERLDDFEWYIITSDRDLGQDTPHLGVEARVWTRVGNAQVQYVPDSASIGEVMDIVRKTPHDSLYLNSFFDFRYSIVPIVWMYLRLLSRRPTLIAPRGEFSPGALQLKSLKKLSYINGARLIGLYRGNILWHASTEVEVEHIRSALPGVRSDSIHIARNISKSLVDVNLLADKGDALRVCFLSRIVRKKNLDYALNVLKRVSVRVRFEIYGPQEDKKYWSECESLIADLPDTVEVVYMGSVHPDDVRDVLSTQDLLFLPTRGENFGHVLIEAWSSGLPVLTSDQTPWRNLESHGVGWDIALGDPDGYAQVLEAMTTQSNESRLAQRRACLDYISTVLQDDVVLQDNRRMFSQVCRQG